MGVLNAGIPRVARMLCPAASPCPGRLLVRDSRSTELSGCVAALKPTTTPMQQLHHRKRTPTTREVRSPCTAGLLSTEAGTLGRFVGNGLLAAAGKLTGLASLSQMAAFARLLFLCLAAACTALLAQLACTYRRLQG